jgi:plastocyanin
MNLFSQLWKILVVADGDRFNNTNPDIHLAANVPEDLLMFNKDSDQHDFTMNELNVKSNALNHGENLTTTLLIQQRCTHEYICTLHPDVMRGNLMVRGT